MDHSEDTDGSGCDSPGILEGQLLLAWLFWIFKHDLKHLGEVLAKMVGCGTLRNSIANRYTSKFKDSFLDVHPQQPVRLLDIRGGGYSAPEWLGHWQR